jgi:multisubunit Na+/H+ antiporter MnhB subunit
MDGKKSSATLYTYMVSFLWLAFAALIVVFVFFSFFLVYHWVKYGIAAQMTTAIVVYFTVAAVIIIVMAGSVISLR